MGETKMNLHDFLQCIFNVIYCMSILVPNIHSSKLIDISLTSFVIALCN